jgi:hypothetical protein
MHAGKRKKEGEGITKKAMVAPPGQVCQMGQVRWGSKKQRVVSAYQGILNDQ